MSQNASHKCPICTVVGLPILPLRYALAWAGDDVPEAKRAPKIEAPFDTSAYPDLGAARAHYTLRLLRGGYLYVYDEARREWSAYEVTPGGGLYAFDIEDRPSAGEKEVSPAMCSRTAPRSLSRCIQVKDPAKASKLWLGHSDTQWTEAVKAKHEDAGYRAKHMRCIDVGGWFKSKGAQSQPHLSALKNVLERVGEYALQAASPDYYSKADADRTTSTLGVTNLSCLKVVPQPAFMFSPYDFAAQERGDFSGVLWGETPDTPVSEEPYAMVALDDPVGITAELAALMNDRLEAFMGEPDRVRPMAASAAILQLRDAIEHQAVLSAAGEDTNSMVYAGPTAMVGYSEGVQYTAQDLKSIREKAWAKDGYLERYDETTRKAWQDRHDEELKALDESVIAPLAKAHVQLLESSPLQLHLQCNHDPSDAKSGAGYLGAFLSCIADTQDKAPQAELYGKWLESDPREQSNLLLRAYTLNQDRLAEQVAKAADGAGEIKWKELAWDQLFGLYGNAESEAGREVSNALMATLLKHTLGPFAKLLGKAADAPVKLYGLLAWGASGRVPLEKVSLAGKTSGELVRSVMLAMEAATGNRPRYQAIHAELRRLRILGLNTGQSLAEVGFIGVRRDGGLVPEALYRAEREGFITNKLVNWRGVIDAELRTGLAGSVLSAVALSIVYDKATKGMQHERTESWVRFYTASASVVGGALELGGKQAERLAGASPRLARWSPVFQLVENIGRRVTAIAGFLMAGIDLYRAVKEFGRKNYKMIGLFTASAISGAGLTIAILASSLFWTGIFFVLVVGVAIAMMIWGDTPMHAWLDRCLWGQLKDERYADMTTEQSQFDLALAD